MFVSQTGSAICYWNCTVPPFLHIANIVIRQTSISGMFTSNEAESGKRCAFALS